MTKKPSIENDGEVLQVQERFCSCGNRTRYFVLALGALCLSILMSSSTAFNFGIICMTDFSTSPLSTGNFSADIHDELPLKDRRFSYSTVERSSLFAAVFAGAFVSLFPLSAAMTKFGIHRVLTVLGLMAALVTMSTPYVAVIGFPAFCILRFIQGIPMAVLFPVIGSIIAQWSALKESGLFVSLLTGHVQISSIFTLPISGALCASSGGWPLVFYVHAVLCFALFILWGIFFRNNPLKHPFVGAREFRKISTGKLSMTANNNTKPKTPIRKILCSIPLWACWIANISNFFVAQFTYTFSPVYYSRVLHYSLAESGLLAIIPLTLQLVLKFLTGTISDRTRVVSELAKVRICNSLAQYLPAVLFVATAFIHPEQSHRIWNTIFLIAASSAIGFNAGGFNKCSVMIAKQYSTQVMVVVQMIILLTLFSGSYIVPIMTPVNDFQHWRFVFLFYAICLIVCNTVFLVFCSVEAAEWTKPDHQSRIKIFFTERY